MSLKLVYFGVRGRAEAIRLLLLDQGVQFEDFHVTPETWFGEWKAKVPFGQLPCLYEGENQRGQTMAILRYLARKHDLYGSGPEEAYRVDMMVEAVQDIFVKYGMMIYFDYENGKQKFIDNTQSSLKQLDDQLKLTNGPLILGSKTSFADYSLFEMMDVLEVLSPGILSPYSAIMAHRQAISERPAIKARRESEAYKSMPCTGSGKQ